MNPVPAPASDPIACTDSLPLQARDLHLQYGQQAVIEALDIGIPAHRISVLVGSNGCGKSTLLKAFARLLPPARGSVILDGKDIRNIPTGQVARQLAVLPQTPVAPDGLDVEQLVRMGRYPHQSWWQQWSRSDQAHVEHILHATGLHDLRHREVETLSGGQRQRAWIAMTLAQDTDILLLDEPTTYLDLAHQIEVLDLLDQLNAEFSKTIVMVLHDLNLAARYAHHMIAVHARNVFAQGTPKNILTADNVKTVFGLDCRVIDDPVYGTPLCVPIGSRPLRHAQAGT